MPDYKQFYFDLVESNKDEIPYWQETYVFSEQYGYNNTRREALEDLLGRFAAEHADISTGGIGENNDWTLTIVRTELGRQVIMGMLADGVIDPVASRAMSSSPSA